MAAGSVERASSFMVGDWHVSRAVNTIERGGQAIHLEPLAMDVLTHLATRPGEVSMTSVRTHASHCIGLMAWPSSPDGEAFAAAGPFLRG